MADVFEAFHANTTIEDTELYLKWNEEKETYETNEVPIHRPSSEIVTLVGQDLEYLNTMDIKNFNYMVFEEDVERLSDSEFEYFWKEFFEDYLEGISEYFIEFDMSQFKVQFSNTAEKKFLLKKIVHFIMMYLPYDVLSNILRYEVTCDIETKAEFDDYLSEIEKEDPEEMKRMLIRGVNKSKYLLNNLIESLGRMVPHSKKGTLETSIKLVEKQVDDQNEYLDFLKTMIENTDSDKLINLVKIYAEMDFENIL